MTIYSASEMFGTPEPSGGMEPLDGERLGKAYDEWYHSSDVGAAGSDDEAANMSLRRRIAFEHGTTIDDPRIQALDWRNVSEWRMEQRSLPGRVARGFLNEALTQPRQVARIASGTVTDLAANYAQWGARVFGPAGAEESVQEYRERLAENREQSRGRERAREEQTYGSVASTVGGLPGMLVPTMPWDFLFLPVKGVSAAGRVAQSLPRSTRLLNMARRATGASAVARVGERAGAAAAGRLGAGRLGQRVASSVGRGVALGATEGAFQGALDGADRAEDAGDFALSVAIGGTLGAALGGSLDALGSRISRGRFMSISPDGSRVKLQDMLGGLTGDQRRAARSDASRIASTLMQDTAEEFDREKAFRFALELVGESPSNSRRIADDVERASQAQKESLARMAREYNLDVEEQSRIIRESLDAREQAIGDFSEATRRERISREQAQTEAQEHVDYLVSITRDEAEGLRTAAANLRANAARLADASEFADTAVYTKMAQAYEDIGNARRAGLKGDALRAAEEEPRRIIQRLGNEYPEAVMNVMRPVNDAIDASRGRVNPDVVAEEVAGRMAGRQGVREPQITRGEQAQMLAQAGDMRTRATRMDAAAGIAENANRRIAPQVEGVRTQQAYPLDLPAQTRQKFMDASVAARDAEVARANWQRAQADAVEAANNLRILMQNAPSNNATKSIRDFYDALGAAPVKRTAAGATEEAAELAQAAARPRSAASESTRGRGYAMEGVDPEQFINMKPDGKRLRRKDLRKARAHNINALTLMAERGEAVSAQDFARAVGLDPAKRQDMRIVHQVYDILDQQGIVSRAGVPFGADEASVAAARLDRERFEGDPSIRRWLRDREVLHEKAKAEAQTTLGRTKAEVQMKAARYGAELFEALGSVFRPLRTTLRAYSPSLARMVGMIEGTRISETTKFLHEFVEVKRFLDHLANDSTLDATMKKFNKKSDFIAFVREQAAKRGVDVSLADDLERALDRLGKWSSATMEASGQRRNITDEWLTRVVNPRKKQDFKLALGRLLETDGSFNDLRAFLNTKEEAARRGGRHFDAEDQMKAIHQFFRGRSRTATKTGSQKQRTIRDIEDLSEKLNEDLSKFYMSPGDAIVQRAEELSRTYAEIMEFRRIAPRLSAEARMMLMDGDTRNIAESLVAAMVPNMNRRKGATNALQAYFNHSRVGVYNKLWNEVRNMSYSLALSKPTAIMIQTEDALRSILVEPSAFTRSSVDIPGNAYRDYFGAYGNAMASFEVAHATGKYESALEKFHRVATWGFRKADMAAKPIMFRAELHRAKRLASDKGRRGASFARDIRSKYGADAEQLLDDLANDRVTDLSLAYLVGKSGEVQPVTALDVPQFYANHPMARALFTLKIFAFNRMSFFYDGAKELFITSVARKDWDLAQHALWRMTATAASTTIAGLLMYQAKLLMSGERTDQEVSQGRKLAYASLNALGISRNMVDTIGQGTGLMEESPWNRGNAPIDYVVDFFMPASIDIGGSMASDMKLIFLDELMGNDTHLTTQRERERRWKAETRLIGQVPYAGMILAGMRKRWGDNPDRRNTEFMFNDFLRD